MSDLYRQALLSVLKCGPVLVPRCTVQESMSCSVTENALCSEVYKNSVKSEQISYKNTTEEFRDKGYLGTSRTRPTFTTYPTGVDVISYPRKNIGRTHTSVSICIPSDKQQHGNILLILMTVV